MAGFIVEDTEEQIQDDITQAGYKDDALQAAQEPVGIVHSPLT